MPNRMVLTARNMFTLRRRAVELEGRFFDLIAAPFSSGLSRHRTERATGRLAPAGIASAHLIEGRYDESRVWAERAIRDQPLFGPVLRVAAASFALTGRLDEAHGEAGPPQAFNRPRQSIGPEPRLVCFVKLAAGRREFVQGHELACQARHRHGRSTSES